MVRTDHDRRARAAGSARCTRCMGRTCRDDGDVGQRVDVAQHAERRRPGDDRRRLAGGRPVGPAPPGAQGAKGPARCGAWRSPARPGWRGTAASASARSCARAHAASPAATAANAASSPGRRFPTPRPASRRPAPRPRGPRRLAGQGAAIAASNFVFGDRDGLARHAGRRSAPRLPRPARRTP
jgi:hypothetical protein